MRRAQLGGVGRGRDLEAEYSIFWKWARAFRINARNPEAQAEIADDLRVMRRNTRSEELQARIDEVLGEQETMIAYSRC
ncbi:hypothetical protein IWQ55_000329 [Labrenzia sp. EL_208]|nr:hypothetical protein [Labrenzia sp. EL_132]MBG6227137.1 hypothetical protein [Labrenzia sp. EL_208]